MNYLVIGLGNYGSVLATELVASGHDVLGTDRSVHKVDMIKDQITSAYVMDASEELALYALPLKSIDVAIVAIGEDLGASVKVVALLKKAKVKTIFARALDAVHEDILKALNVDKVLKPERFAAKQFVLQMNATFENV